MSDRAADVVVAGGGPAGAATAALLAQRGLDVLVLEQAAFPRPKPCAEYLSPGVIDVLDRLGALAAVRRAEAAWLQGMRVRAQRRDCTLTYPTGRGPDGQRLALGIARLVLDHLLLDHARARGAQVRERHRVGAALLERGRVIGVRARGPSGEEDYLARLVVGADGLHSAVARSLGLRRGVPWPRRLGLVARFAGARGIERFGEMHVGHGLYCGLAPVGQGLVSVGLVVGWGSKPRGESTEAFFRRRLAALPGVARALRDARLVTPVRGVGPLARRVGRPAGPGYLLVGDAAGFFDPFVGEGIYRALRGAELAAEAAARALAVPDQPIEDLLLAYTRARRAAFGDKERVSLLVQLLLNLPPLFERVVARLADRPHLARLLGGVLGDYQPAGPALRPGFLWSLLGP